MHFKFTHYAWQEMRIEFQNAGYIILIQTKCYFEVIVSAVWHNGC